jgi:hypothetical protein
MSEGEKPVVLPSWAGNLAGKIVPWAIMVSIAGIATLYTDNIGNKRDIVSGQWRDDQQDGRLEKIEKSIAGMDERQADFHREALWRLDEIRAAKEVRKR